MYQYLTSNPFNQQYYMMAVFSTFTAISILSMLFQAEPQFVRVSLYNLNHD